MKKSFVLTLAATVAVALSGTANAHIGTKVYPIYELPTSDLPDIRDNSLADWEDVLPGASLDQNEFAPLNVGDGAGINPADLAYRAFFAWNSASQHLYMAIERVDDKYVNTYAGGDLINLWQFDSIEFMVDGDHTGGAYNGFDAAVYTAEEIKLLANFQAQQYVGIAEAPDGRLLGYQGSGQGWVPLPPWADAGGYAEGESPNTSVIEMYVTPWDECNWQGPELSKRSELSGNKIIGFQLSVPDFDTDPGAYHGFHTLSGQANTWRMAENFVDGQLIPCDTGDCGNVPTAVETDSWGRIKASLK
ncbi:MAG: hypothetical protein IT369_08805 [Candidatus Latescibacteria bacterium]|nr:hypothetical protein [Candidatus Latescibacterota bacterium]